MGPVSRGEVIDTVSRNPDMLRGLFDMQPEQQKNVEDVASALLYYGAMRAGAQRFGRQFTSAAAGIGIPWLLGKIFGGK